VQHTNQFYLDGFLLSVDNYAYLVEIKSSEKKVIQDSGADELPDWMFDSRHAIWLTDENLPIRDRAAHGESIRQKLKNYLFRRKS
jgi:hypothetical protein